MSDHVRSLKCSGICDGFHPYMILHWFHSSALCNIDAEVPSAFMKQEYWDRLSIVYGFSPEQACGWVWLSLAQDTIFIWLPVVYCTVAFGGIEGAAG